jgi:hydroxymethylbilane synthase
MKGRIIIGSRRSKLALLQTQEVVDTLAKAYPHLSFEIVKIKTEGDRDRNTSLKILGGSGVFVKDLENALLRRDIDIAVHSLKDMPADTPDGLMLAAVNERLDPRDVLISNGGLGLSKLAPGSRIGTGSQRRAVQLLAQRRDVAVVDMRGNIDTRLRKCSSGEVDGVMMAAAAVVRMKLDNRVTEYLSPDTFIPAVGQGALGIEVRAEDSAIIELVAPLKHESSWMEVTAERSFLKALGGGCREPIAALGVVKGESLRIRGMVAGSATGEVMHADVEGDASQAEHLGVLLAQKMVDLGAERLIGRIG